MSHKNWKQARKYFGIEGNYNLVLHHKDETLKINNPERYHEWRPEDLIVLTIGEHNSLHKKGSTISEKGRANMSKGNKKPKTQKWKDAHRAAMIKKGYWHEN